jgi:AAA domain
VRAADVTPQTVEWLWHPYIPLGKISMVAGQMGQAKSLLTAWLAADTAPHGAIMLSAEDDVADTIRPRLEAQGADLNRLEKPGRPDMGGTVPPTRRRALARDRPDRAPEPPRRLRAPDADR